MKGSGLRRLTLKEFDAALLKKLTSEGRVYVRLPKVVDVDAYMREILDYVSTIRCFATDVWQDDIDELWQEIVDSDCLADFLKMQKGVQAGHMNRYAVTNLVCRMQNNGIYRNDIPMVMLHLTMEGTTKKNKYYTSSGNYDLSKTAKNLLKRLFRKYKMNDFIPEGIV